LLAGVPVAGDLGDQQAALFGQTCFSPGEPKTPMARAVSMLLNTGTKPIQSKNGLLTTLGYKIGNQPAVYCLEGSVAITGALVQWLRDNLKFFDVSARSKKTPAPCPTAAAFILSQLFLACLRPTGKAMRVAQLWV